MKANQVVFQDLLNGKIQYAVPLYQRTYSWEEKQWEQLWMDLLEVYDMSKPRNHFIGSVVTQQVLTSPEGTSRYTLIDGQQRMTTLFVILGVIQQKAKQEAYDDLAEEIRYSCLLNQFGKGEERTKLMPTQRDREAFALMMNGEIPTDRSQIAKARDYFEEALRGGDADGNEIDFRKLYRSTVLHLDMVSILLEGDDSPNRIFESLNNTGMPLSVADLIRNYLLMNIPGMEQQDGAYNDYWYPMQELLAGGSRDALGDFFWRYLMMGGSLTRKDDTYDAIRAHLKSPTPEEVIRAMKKFSKFSRYYAQMTEICTSGLDGTLTGHIRRLNQWEVDVAYPFLMGGFDRLNSGRICHDHLVSVMQMIESFVVRRTVCGIPTNQLRRIFTQMSGQMDTDDIVGFTRTCLSENRWPLDDEFRSKFVNFRLHIPSRLNRTRLVLTTLERSFGHKEVPDMTSDITIEHIMPQTLSSEWKEVLGEGATDIHERWLDTVGNLRGCLQSLELVLSLMNEPQIVPQRPDGRTVGDPRAPTPTSQTRRPTPYSGPAGGSERHPVFASERMPLADGPARSASLADPVQVLPQLDHGWNVGTSQ